MKSVITLAAAALLAASFAISADAATAKKDTAMSAKQQSCHQQAVKKYSAIHFLKRRAFEKKCMGAA